MSDFRPYSHSAEEVVSEFGSETEEGLSPSEAQKRLEKYGPNLIEKQKTRPWYKILLNQFVNPIVWVLVVAGALAVAFGDNIEAIAILIVILVNAAIGFIMEMQAVKSMEALRKLSAVHARVLRNGEVKSINAEEIVPGDILDLDAGDVVPADARVIHSVNTGIKEAALTGESTLVEKHTDPLEPKTVLADQRNMVFSGTIMARGHARAVVTGTGKDTEIGRISEMVSETSKGKTVLEKRLHNLSKKLIWLTLGVAALVVGLGMIREENLVQLVKTAIALAVAAIPEGLPIVATIALARGMLRLAKQQVIVKRLEAVQTLGEVNVICSDKTGTLTENKMEVEHLVIAVEGGELLVLEKDEWEAHEAAKNIIRVGVLCNHATLNGDEESGDPVEIALLHAAQQLGKDPVAMRNEFPEKEEVPFDADIKMMGTLNKVEDGYLACVKGALEAIWDQCEDISLNGKDILLKNFEKWEQKADELAKDGYRLLAFASRKTDKTETDFIHDLTFLGIAAFWDPPREDVRDAIRECHTAGIQVMMVTGDHPETAATVARATGVIGEYEEAIAIHGKDLQNDISEELKQKMLKAQIFARVSPGQKLDLVRLLQEKGRIVGMTGDGVNDAPSLQKADIGIAMGMRGTEAAKDAADMILKDDAFSSIVLAVRQGRVIFRNIRNFIVYLLSCNLSEILVVMAASLLDLPMPLLPLQILFLNLVTDVFPALALGMNKGEPGIMKRPPRDPQEPLVPGSLWRSLGVYGLCLTVGVIGITIFAEKGLQASEIEVNNMGFLTLMLAQLWNVFNIPGREVSFFFNEVTKNKWIWLALFTCLLITIGAWLLPPVREAMNLTFLNFNQMTIALAFSIFPVVLIQALKRTGIIH